MAGRLKEKHSDNRKLFVRRWMLLTPTWEATKERTNCERNNLKLKWAVIGTTGWDGEGSFCSSLTHDPAPCHRPVKARRLAQQWVRCSVSQLHSFCCTTPHAPLTRQRSALTSLQDHDYVTAVLLGSRFEILAAVAFTTLVWKLYTPWLRQESRSFQKLQQTCVICCSFMEEP